MRLTYLALLLLLWVNLFRGFNMIRRDVLCSDMGVGVQRIHLFASYGTNRALHSPYTDTFLILAHGMFQSRRPGVVHLKAAGATAEFLAWVLHYSSSTTWI